MNEAPEGDGLYLSDKAIAAKLGVGENLWYRIFPMLETQGLPKRDPVFGHRRYWPAVRAFLDRRNGLGRSLRGFAPNGEEHWNETERRARSQAPAPG